MKQSHPYLAADWTDEDLDRIKAVRTAYAKKEQDLVARIKKAPIEEKRELKPDLKECQAYVKAATILLDYFYGKGRFKDRVPRDGFPEELEWHFMVLLAKL